MSRNIEEYVINIYKQALSMANKESYNREQHQKNVIKQIQKKNTYKQIEAFVGFQINDWVQDILEVANDIRAVSQNKQKNKQRMIARSKMHFQGIHYQDLQVYRQKKYTKRVLEMYENKQFQTNDYISKIYPNCIYLLGLIKGNGVIINKQSIVSCAHIFIDQQTQKIFQIKCFANGLGDYGLVKIRKQNVFLRQDMVFGQIIYFSKANINQISLQIPKQLKFQSFVPIPCIQIGLLYYPQEYLQTFYTSQGFIQRNLYKDKQDLTISNEMGLLIHNCYGLWGTSGSPIWNSKGQLLGLHNSWNSQSQTISMIVHDDIWDNKFIQQNRCRVVKQYQRRAISVHVLNILYQRCRNEMKKKQIKKLKKNRKQIVLNKQQN